MPGRGDALVGAPLVTEAIGGTRAFLSALYETAAESVAKGLSLKETFAAVRGVMDEPFGAYAIYEHCLPFNVSRAYDEARGLDWPVVWTDSRDRQMGADLQS